MKTTLASILALVFFAAGATTVFAASLYLEPTSGTYSEGTTFPIKVRLNTLGECVNAAQVQLNFPNDSSIRAIDVLRGESIFSLWTEDPVIDNENGRVTFSGGLPGGYCGRIEGDPGLTNIIAEVIFQVPGTMIGGRPADEGEIVFDESSIVLLNDGRGTEAELVFGNSLFNIVPPGQANTEFDWFRSITDDNIKPEPFSIELIRDQSAFDGKWFIIFNTLDKQTGIDHFEVYETSIENEGFVFGKKEQPSAWKEARSPYLLEDQTLNSVIRVRAYDKAGNDRLAGYVPDETLREVVKPALSKGVFYSVLGVIVLIVIGIIVFLMYRRLKKKTKEERDTIQDEQSDQGGEQAQVIDQYEGDDFNQQN